MLIIRKEQMEALSISMLERFQKRMLEHIKNTFPERTKQVIDEKMYEVIHYSIKKAESYGVEYEDDIRRFIELLIIYGSQLDTKPETRWIVNVLRRNDLTGTAKMDMIDDYELQTIRESYD